MRSILMFAFVILGLKSHAATMQDIRDLLEVASTDEASNQRLVDLTKSYTLKENPVLYAYHAAGVMTMANHVYWPGTKLDYFNEGKEKLEKAVNFALTNVEIRFIRYCVQKGSPSMLGYTDDISEDKKYILKHIGRSGWSKDYQDKVVKFLNEE